MASYLSRSVDGRRCIERTVECQDNDNCSTTKKKNTSSYQVCFSNYYPGERFSIPFCGWRTPVQYLSVNWGYLKASLNVSAWSYYTHLDLLSVCLTSDPPRFQLLRTYAFFSQIVAQHLFATSVIDELQQSTLLKLFEALLLCSLRCNSFIEVVVPSAFWASSGNREMCSLGWWHTTAKKLRTRATFYFFTPYYCLR